MPKGVPPIVEDSLLRWFRYVRFDYCCCYFAGAGATSFENFHNVIYTVIQAPLQGFGLSPCLSCNADYVYSADVLRYPRNTIFAIYSTYHGSQRRKLTQRWRGAAPA